jgi:hypothetical protein
MYALRLTQPVQVARLPASFLQNDRYPHVRLKLTLMYLRPDI